MSKPKGMFSRFSYVDVHLWIELLHEDRVLELYQFGRVSSARQMRELLERIRAGMARDKRIHSVHVTVDSPVDQKTLGRKVYRRTE